MEEGTPQQSWQPQNEQEPFQQTTGPAELPSVTWSASEFISHQKASTWYLGLGVGAAILTVLIFAITRNILSALVVAGACIVIGIFAARQPETKLYEINEDGVKVGDRFFPYNIFKSFSILDEGGISCLWLRPLKRFMPTVTMYYAPEDEERIVLMLENFLPEEDRQLDVVERISRRIRF